MSVVALVACVVMAAWVEVIRPLRDARQPLTLAVGPATLEAHAPPVAPGPTAPVDLTRGGATTGAVVRFVYFVEQDQEEDPAAADLIARQALALQQFWFDQFGGTFVVADQVDIVYGDHPAAWYDTTPSGDDPRWYRLMNIRDEILLDLGLDPGGTSTRFVAYPQARIDGRVGANRYGGAVMDGDDIACITGQVATTPYSPDYPANCLATVAHELGHVFGLDHQGPDGDCMQFGFYQYVNASETCQFSAANRSIVLNDVANALWLAATPGAGAAG